MHIAYCLSGRNMELGDDWQPVLQMRRKGTQSPCQLQTSHRNLANTLLDSIF